MNTQSQQTQPDYKDKLIMTHLRTEGNAKLENISINTQLPISTIHDRIHRLQKKNLITSTILINYEEAGYPVRSIITLKTSEVEQAKEFIIQNKHTNTLFVTRNEANLLGEFVFKNFLEQEEFLHKLKQYGTVHSHPIITTISQEKILPTTLT